MMISEITTIFNNIRKILTSHNINEGLAFILNGLLFALTFLVFRGMFLVWLICTRFYPAFARDHYAQSDPLFIHICIYVILVFYSILCALNFFWLFLIFKQVYKAANPKAEK